MSRLVPVINKAAVDWEIGDPENLFHLISVVEHKNFDIDLRRLQGRILFEVVR